MHRTEHRTGALRSLLPYLRPHAGALTGSILLVLVVTASSLMRPILLGDVIDLISAGEPFSGALQLGGQYLILLAAGVACNMLQMWMLQRIGQDVIYAIRKDLFGHVHQLSLRYFDVTPTGRPVTRITNDVETLNELFSTVLGSMVKNIALVIGLAAVMLALNRKLALISFVLLPLVCLLTGWFTKQYRSVHRVTRTRLSMLNSFLSEHLSSMKLIQIFHREREKTQEFDTRSESLFRSNYREILVQGIFRPIVYWISILALAIVLYFGSGLVLAGTISLGTLYVFTSYIRQFFDPIQSLADQFGTLQSAAAAMEKIAALLNEEVQVKQPEQPVVLESPKGRIVFDHVWFSYDGEEWILKDVNFTVEPGQTVAFVGATGAGKSTILNLIGRYYDIQRGSITVDGIDIRELDTDSLRRAVGQVQQDVFLFTGDIRSNIRLRDQDISDADVEAAARTVNADGFIRSLEHGYEEAVTERGSTLSAGQRQLLSFARTLAHDPAVLVMDEATANIDTGTELLIQEALGRLMQGRTTIVVAHRLSTIQHADTIMVMHKGRLREQGTHQELLAQNGIYKKLYDLQMVME